LEEDTGLALLLPARGGVAQLSHRSAAFEADRWELLGPRLLHYVEALLGLDAGSAGVGDDTAKNSVSPCFFYHSTPRVPEPLVYAAELLCVLHGRKALVMVQYGTPTEAQHRHPLVRPLVRAMLAAAHAEPAAVDVGHSVLRYRKDSTLVLYRRRHAELARALRPEGQAQALHPVPYPNYDGPPEILHAEEHAQVYNSGWNGFVLGYPQDLVDSYCAAFHNGLTPAQKRSEGKRAQTDVEQFFRSRQLRRLTGAAADSDEAVPREALERLYEAVYKDTGSHNMEHWN